MLIVLEILPTQPFQPVVSPSPSAIAGWMTNANPPLPHAAVAQGPPGLVQPPNTGKHFYILDVFFALDIS